MHANPSFLQCDRTSSCWLSRTVAPVVLALSLGLSAAAQAELVVTDGKPVFSTADLDMIARNEILRARVSSEPWLVFRVLRELDKAPPERNLFPSRDPGAPSDFDANKNPDLDRLERAAPEAAHDLFLLLKKAGGAGQPK